MERRGFIAHAVKAATAAAVAPLLPAIDSRKAKANHTIDTIELFRYDINTPRHFSWGTWHNRQHVFMRITSGEHTGWAEVAADKNNPELDTRAWGRFLQDFKKLSLDTYQTSGAGPGCDGRPGGAHQRAVDCPAKPDRRPRLGARLRDASGLERDRARYSGRSKLLSA